MKRIALVEDDPHHAELIRRAFEATGDKFELQWITTLADARRELARTPPDLALVDFRLPDGLGSTLVELSSGRFPVVLLTAYGSERMAVEIIKSGALDYIVKTPDMFEELPHLVARASREWDHIRQRVKAEAALHESEMRFRRLLEATPHVAVQGYLPDGIVNYWNQASQTVFGYTPDEALGQDLATLLWPPANRPAFHQDLQHMVATQQALPAREISLSRKDGSVVPVYASHALLPSNLGPPQLFLLASDLTERQLAETQRIEMERRLLHSQKLESLGVLAGGIAHDFNNLLTAVLGNLSMARLDLPEASLAYPSIVEAEGAARRAADLTRQILAYSGRGRFQIKRINLNELVVEMSRLLKVSISKTATLHFRLHENLPLVLGDAVQLQQVVMNLITNASEAIGERVGVITLATDIQNCTATDLARSRLEEIPAPGPYVVLETTDTGCGMDVDVQARLFDPFFTTKFTGRGLGMAGVLGVVRGHHGAIFVQSAPGAGTTIRVLFPITPLPEVCPASPPLPSPGSTRPQNLHPGGSLLIVDDEEAIRTLAQRMLTRAGYQVITACDGEEGVRCYREQADSIRCVLLDLTMPKRDGLWALDQIRNDQPEMPALLLSGYDEMEVRRRLPTAASTRFLQKPGDATLLLQEVRALLEPSPPTHPAQP